MALNRPVLTLCICLLASSSSATASPTDQIRDLFRAPPNLNELIEKARRVLTETGKGPLGIVSSAEIELVSERAVADTVSTSIRFAQRFKGVPVFGDEAMVHFNRAGKVLDVAPSTLVDVSLDTNPRLTAEQAYRVLANRYGEAVGLSQPAELNVFKDLDGRAHLAYHMLTKSSPTHLGQEVFVDAHDGSVVLEFDRACDTHTPSQAPRANRGSRVVFSGDTDRARDHVNGKGYPTDIDMEWYAKALENGARTDEADRSAVNAYINSGRVFQYYKTTFNRDSFDNAGSPIVSVVHMGVNMNNAFWTNEFRIMAYGDGDDRKLTDLSYALDVAGHEITHAVTSSTAKLVYAGEAGALNESYSDFFGKMIDYSEGDWDIAARVVSPHWKRRALRNMKNPEEFEQPGTNDSPLRVPTTGNCSRVSDHCGVHTNSGIPNRAAALIVEAIGKEKAEQLYYNVLTKRLTETSGFRDARVATEKECQAMHEAMDQTGVTEADCREVTKAFDAVKM